jgi:hypothetical protein
MFFHNVVTFVVLQNIKYEYISCNLRERVHRGDPGIDERIILGWIFRKLDVEVRTGLCWLTIETVGGYL